MSCFFITVLFSHAAKTKELLLVAGWEKPPYIISSQNSGFEIELMRQVLTNLGHTISILYVPYGRTYETFKHEHADIALTLTTSAGVPSKILSLPYVSYQNVAISLKNGTATFNNMDDLKNLSIIAFQNASKILGMQFANAVHANEYYFELPDQRRQAEMLLLGNVDVVVMDINIFNYFSQQISGENQMSRVNVHSFFPTTHYSAAIKNPKLLVQFNQAYEQFSLSDEYRQLIKKYQLVYQD